MLACLSPHTWVFLAPDAKVDFPVAKLLSPVVGYMRHHPCVDNALGVGVTLCSSAFLQVQFFCVSSRWIFVCLVFGFIVCLVSSFRYWFLAASRLVARFAHVARFARWACPSGPPELST